MLIYLYNLQNKMILGGVKMRQRVRLDTMTDIQKFTEVVSRIDERVFLEDNTGYKVSARSLLGALLSMEWEEVYVHCEKDISVSILPWII